MARLDRIRAAVLAGRPIDPDDGPLVLAAVARMPQPSSDGLAERNRLIREYFRQHRADATSERGTIVRFLAEITNHESSSFQFHRDKVSPPADLSPKQKMLWMILFSIAPDAQNNRGTETDP